jgi:hypothetical protein
MPPTQLVIVHPVARVDAKNIPARLRASPVKIPVVVGRHLHPAALLKVVQQHRLVHVGAEANLQPRVLIVRDPANGKFQAIPKDFYLNFTAHLPYIVDRFVVVSRLLPSCAIMCAKKRREK